MFNAAYVYDTQSFDTKAQVTKLADFSGKRICVLASEGEQAQVKALGGSPVPMSLQEVLPALQQGTIDGVSSGIPVFVAFKYYDAAPYILDTHLWALCTLSLVSKIWYDRLPPDLQKAVMDAGARAEPQVNAWNVTRLKQDRETWMQQGGKMATLSAAEQEEAVRRVSAAVEPSSRPQRGGERPSEVTAAIDRDRIEPQPGSHRLQLAGQGFGHGARPHARLDVGRPARASGAAAGRP